MPRFSAAELPTQPEVVATIRWKTDEQRRQTIGNLTDEQNDARIDVVELKNFVKVELKFGNIFIMGPFIKTSRHFEPPCRNEI